MSTATKKPAAKKPAAKKAPAKKAPIPASENAPDYQVVDQTFIWQDAEVGTVRVPLRFKMKLLRAVMKIEELTELEQLFALLDGINDQATQDQIDEMWTDDAMRMIEAYFDEFEKINQASRGES